MIIKVSEKGMFSAYTGTSFTRDDVNFDASGTLRNVIGFAEVRTRWIDGLRGSGASYLLLMMTPTCLPAHLLTCVTHSNLSYMQTVQGTYSRSRLGSRSMRITYAKPRIYGAGIRFETDIHEDTHNYERTSSLREKTQGLGLHWTTQSESLCISLP